MYLEADTTLASWEEHIVGRQWRRLVAGFIVAAAVIGNGIQVVPACAVPERFSVSVANGESAHPDELRAFADESGLQPDPIVISGRPPAVKMLASSLPEPTSNAGVSVLLNVPAFDWSYGCSATSAAMLFGYYDNVGYANMYAGPANGGVCPMNNAVWGAGESPLSASHNGIDGRTTKGHVDDYWIAYENASQDPYVGNWPEHVPLDCTGDFMGTNQSRYGNSDGSTTFWLYSGGLPLYDYVPPSSSSRDGCHGLRLFAESRGYTVTTNFTQRIVEGLEGVSGGFAFDNFKSEIDAGRPVLIHVTNHTMLGYGYSTADQTIQIRDTWDYSSHTMTWGGVYAGLQHYAVTVIRLAAYTLTAAASPSAGGTIAKSPDQPSYAPGAIVTLSAVPSTGYTFTSWSGGTTGTVSPVDVTMTTDKTVTATFTINTYALTVSTVGSGSVARSPDQALYDHGTIVSLTAAPSLGYVLSGWTGATPDGVDPLEATVTMDANKTATATFTAVLVPITVSMLHGTAETAIPESVPYGSTLTITVTPDIHYYVYAVTCGGFTTPLDAVGRNLGLARTLSFSGVTWETANISVDIYRRGDVAGNGGPDGKVNIMDASVVIAQWRATGEGFLGDLNCDGIVDIFDISMLMSLWQP
jgi:uncharacterized repeat protein (TIGR02543 family)